MQVKNIMTKNVKTINSDATIQDAAKIMKDLNVGSVPVCEGSQLVGIITDRDIALRNVAEGENAATSVRQVMSKHIIKGTPDMNDYEAAELMADNQIRRLPILENEKLIGIVSLGDLAVNSKTDTEAGKALSTISKPSKPER